MGTRLSALCTSRPPDRIPPGNPAVVGLLAERYRYRRDGRTDAAGVDDGKCETGGPPRHLAGPLDCRTFVAAAGNNAAAAVLDRCGAARNRGAFDGARRTLAADGRYVFRRLGSIRSRARSGTRPARRRRALAGFRDG